ACALRGDRAREFHRVDPGGAASAMGEDFPPPGCHRLGVNGDDDALAAEAVGGLRHDVGIGDGGGVEADLVGAGEEERAHVLLCADAAADGQRDVALLRRAGDEVVHRAAVFMRGVEVEKAELVRPGSVIGLGRLDRIAGVDQVDEVHALDDAAVGHVEAGDDAGLEHGFPLGSTRGLAKRRVSGLPCGMVKLVLLHRADSSYDDEPDREYDFPRDYLRAAEDGVGDWIVYSEPVKAGPRGYFAVARLERIIPNPRTPGRFLAVIEPGSYLEFDRPVSRLHEGRPMESALTYPDGRPKPGGLTQSSVRRLPECEFAAIVSLGLPADLEAREARRYDAAREADDPPAPFERPVIERLTSRPFRDVAFRRKVRAAYDYRCAISGLRLRNGGG